MQTMFVKPAPGRLVRFPDNPDRVLDDSGDEVPVNSYWSRRVKEGDVIKSKPARDKGGK